MCECVRISEASVDVGEERTAFGAITGKEEKKEESWHTLVVVSMFEKKKQKNGENTKSNPNDVGVSATSFPSPLKDDTRRIVPSRLPSRKIASISRVLASTRCSPPPHLPPFVDAIKT